MQLQTQIVELQDSLDSLVWDRKELQEHIRIAIKEHEMMELMLGELEEEHNEAIHKIKLLENAVCSFSLNQGFFTESLVRIMVFGYE